MNNCIIKRAQFVKKGSKSSNFEANKKVRIPLNQRLKEFVLLLLYELYSGQGIYKPYYYGPVKHKPCNGSD